MNRFIVQLLSTVGLLSGCGKSDPKFADTKPTAADTWLVVTGDNKLIEQARLRARTRDDETYEHAFSNLEKPSFIERETLNLLRSRSTEAVPRLTTQIKKGINNRGIGAALLLLKLEHPTGLSYLADAIETGTVDQRVRVIQGLGEYGGDFFPEEVAARRLILADARIVAQLARQLGDDDERILKAAIQT